MPRFEKGNPGGPGRPRGRIAKFREALANLTDDGKEIAEGLASIWRDADADPKERLAAFELALHYLLGKPEAAVSIEADITARPAELDGPALLRRLPSAVIDAVLVELEGKDPPLLLQAGSTEDLAANGH